jgi:hypothetical protein
MPTHSKPELHRLSSDVDIVWNEIELTTQTQCFIRGLDSAHDLGSLFVESETPLCPDSVVSVAVSCRAPGHGSELRALAVVESPEWLPWRRGMALRLVEIDAAQRPRTAELFESLLAAPPAPVPSHPFDWAHAAVAATAVLVPTFARLASGVVAALRHVG